METALEHILTHAHKPAITSYLDAHPNELEAAVQLAVSYKQPYAWRAGWFLWSYLKLNDPRIKRTAPRNPGCDCNQARGSATGVD